MAQSKTFIILNINMLMLQKQMNQFKGHGHYIVNHIFADGSSACGNHN